MAYNKQYTELMGVKKYLCVQWILFNQLEKGLPEDMI